MTKVTISDAAKALCALEEERKKLWEEAQEVSHAQCKLMADTSCEMLRLSGKHAVILDRMMKLDDVSVEIRKKLVSL